jgi:hypothetical protein
MANAVYTELASTAEELIAAFGRTITYRPGGTVYVDPDEPWRGKVLASPVTITAAVFDAKASDARAFPELTYAKRAIVAASTITLAPALGDSVTDEGVRYGVAKIETSGPGDTVIAYTLYLTTEG